ncbi:hypothetical protein PYCC9005_005344 [Savitreella phatthalungensis]
MPRTNAAVGSPRLRPLSTLEPLYEDPETTIATPASSTHSRRSSGVSLHSASSSEHLPSFGNTAFTYDLMDRRPMSSGSASSGRGSDTQGSPTRSPVLRPGTGKHQLQVMSPQAKVCRQRQIEQLNEAASRLGRAAARQPPSPRLPGINELGVCSYSASTGKWQCYC